ncbi:MAG: iron-containing alcohol dehydrogenase [Clostridia bacterium]|nr:iron-containing alcohol dehydrogenase [Clostridia bacterium]
MNFFKKLYCRSYQTIFKLMLPFLPYRQPTILNSNDEVCNVLIKNNIQNVLLVTDEGIKSLNLTNKLEEQIKNKNINLFIYDKTVPNPTTENVEQALNIYKQNNCQALIAFGGGSVMDCAKAVGAKIAKPHKTLNQMKGVLKVGKKIPLLIAVPTTAGTGSETTLAAVITDSKTRHKYAINDFPLIPKYALLDETLTVGLPKHITATTGMDALTHAIEAYIGKSTTKQTRTCALFAIKTILENILKVYETPQDLKARKNMLIASYNAGIAFTKSYVGYVHAVAHTLGGKYNTPHGLANAVILPVVLKIYGKSAHKKLWKIGLYCKLFNSDISYEKGANIFINKIQQINTKMQIGTTIDALNKQDIPQLAKIADHEANPLYPVPQLWDAKKIEQVYYAILENK